jgi:diguanylate cyclase (GGDEF)-like protein
VVRLPPDDIDGIDAMGRAVVAGDVSHDLFTPLAHRISEALDIAECAIYTVQPRERTVRAVAVWSRESCCADTERLGVMESLADRWDFATVLAQGAIVELYADSEVLDEGERARMRRAGQRTTLTAPLTAGGDVIGLVNAIEKRGQRRFTAAERALFDAYCQAAAMAIHADALNRLLEERNAELGLRLLERDRMAEELRALSLRDEMTGLFNRRGFFTLGNQQFKLARRIGHRCTVAFVDVDGMKGLNDSYGHAAGDQALRTAAQLLRETFREADIVARLGGDEFVVLMVESEVPHAAAEAAETRLAAAVAAWRRSTVAAWSKLYDLSVGVAECPRVEACDLEELIDRADTAMYSQKRDRRALRRHAG